MLDNEKEEPVEADLKSVGSTLLYDSIFLFIFPPISLIALVANIVSFYIFSARYFRKKPLYTYLRASCLNSSLMNLVLAISFLCDSRRFIQIANTELATYFRCYFKIPIVNTAHFYGSVIEIVLAIDRLVEFTRLKARFRQANALKISISLFVACLVINAPYILVFEPKKRQVLLDNGNSSTTRYFYFYGESEFALSYEGRILKNIQYFIRDILTLVLLFFINLVSLVLFKKEYKLDRMENHEKVIYADQIQRDESWSKSKSNGGGDSSLINNTQQNPMTNTANYNNNNQLGIRRSSLEALQNTLNKNNLYMSVTQVRSMLARMVFIICAFSLSEHLFLTLSLQMFTTRNDSLKLHMIFLTNVSMLLKHSINFWIFFYFNTFFRKRFTYVLSKKIKF